MFVHRRNGNYEEISNTEFFNSYTKGTERILAIDFDGVWVSCAEYKSELFKKAGYDIPLEITNRDLATGAGVPTEIYMNVSKKAGLEILEHGIIEPDLKNSWAELMKIPDLKVYIVTSRYDYMIPVVLSLIKKTETFVDGIFNEIGRASCRERV